MKIAYISDFLPEYHTRAGGADWACLRVGKLCEKNGYAIDYYTNAPDKLKARESNTFFVPIIEWLLPKFVGRAVEILKWYVFQLDPFALVYFLWAFSRRKYDAVHIHRFRFITMAPIVAARLLRLPVLFSVYDYWMFCTLETLNDHQSASCRRFHGPWCVGCLPQKMTGVQRLLLRFRKQVFDAALSRIEHFIVLSRSSHDIVRDYGIPVDRIHIIPLPYGGEFKENGTDNGPEPGTLVYIGWIQKRKGLAVLIEAMKLVKDVVPSAKLNVIGPDVALEKEYRAAIESRIVALGLTDTVHLLGPKNNTEVQSYIRSAVAVVVPEQWENMSPVIVGEAMFNQRPVIGSRIGGIPDFVSEGETGWLFEPASAASLADKIILTLKDPVTARQYGINGRKRAEKIYNDDTISAAYAQVYGEIRTKELQ